MWAGELVYKSFRPENLTHTRAGGRSFSVLPLAPSWGVDLPTWCQGKNGEGWREGREGERGLRGGPGKGRGESKESKEMKKVNKANRGQCAQVKAGSHGVAAGCT